METEVEVLAGKSSTHKSEVVPVVLRKHPNADSLSVVSVWGYEVVVNTQSWEGITKGVYIVPDSVVDVKRPEFSFLADNAKSDGTARIKTRKIRNILSQGLLVPAPSEANIGDDYSDILGVKRYEPPEDNSRSGNDKFIIGGECEKEPDLNTGPSKYDVESFERYAKVVFEEGEPIYIMEKVDGSNVRYVYHDGRYWVKSRTRWLKRTPDYSHVSIDSLVSRGLELEKAREIYQRVNSKEKSINGFWQQLEKSEETMKFLKDNPGVTVYGEIYGNTNRLKYGFDEVNRFSVFDIYKEGRFLDVKDAIALGNKLSWVPFLRPIDQTFEYNFDKVKSIVSGPTLCDGAKKAKFREGIVIKPVKERYNPIIGRVCLKSHSAEFLNL